MSEWKEYRHRAFQIQEHIPYMVEMDCGAILMILTSRGHVHLLVVKELIAETSDIFRAKDT